MPKRPQFLPDLLVAALVTLVAMAGALMTAWGYAAFGVAGALGVGSVAALVAGGCAAYALRTARHRFLAREHAELATAIPEFESAATAPDEAPWPRIAQLWGKLHDRVAEGESAQTLCRTFDEASLPCVVLDKHGQVVWHNQAYRAAAGDKGAIPPGFEAAGKLAIRQSATEVIQWQGRTFELVATRTADESHAVVVFLVDVSARARVEEEIQSIIGAAEVGNFDGRVSVSADGRAGLGASVNRLLEAISSRIAELCAVMERLSVGDLTQRISVDYESGAVKLTGQFRGQVAGPYEARPATADGSNSATAGRVRLYSADLLLNDNFDVVDRFTAVTGSVATVFVREDKEFYRITTSVRTDSGQRAIGTKLDRAHKAYERVVRGERFVGPADLFGRRYMTCYDPIRDASGTVVGIVFVGFDMGAEHNLFVRLRDEVERTCENLTTMLGAIQSATGAVSTASAEIAAGNSDLASRTEAQSSDVEQTLRRMSDLALDTHSNAAKADEAYEVAQEAQRRAKEGGKKTEEVRSSMEVIHASSRKIADITGLIDGLAFQTNLLALNAAVEAARAGSEGRGFAVVASEVRLLAQQSAAAAKDIKTLIGETVLHIDAGARVAREAGVAMTQTGEVISRVTQLTGDISAASARQRESIDAVNGAMTSVGHAVEQNAALVEEASAAAQSLKEQAQALSEETERFVIKPEEAAEAPLLRRA